jgi:hypothetical protein
VKKKESFKNSVIHSLPLHSKFWHDSQKGELTGEQQVKSHPQKINSIISMTYPAVLILLYHILCKVLFTTQNVLIWILKLKQHNLIITTPVLPIPSLSHLFNSPRCKEAQWLEQVLWSQQT